MSDVLVFWLIVAAVIVFPIAAYLIARRGRTAAICAATGALAALLAYVATASRPEWIAGWLAHTDLALFYPSWGAIPAMVMLVAVRERAQKRLRRALALLVTALAVYCVWDASHLLAAPSARLCDENLASPVCYQSTTWSCAPAAAVSLLRVIGVPATEAELADLMNTRSHRGTGDLQVQRALEHKLHDRGLTARLRSLDWDALVEAGGLALVPVQLSPFRSHMVAVIRADNWSADVIDPLTGPKRLLREQLESIWLERAILVQPDLPWLTHSARGR